MLCHKASMCSLLLIQVLHGLKVSMATKQSMKFVQTHHCLVPRTCLPWQTARSCCAVYVGAQFAQV